MKKRTNFQLHEIRKDNWEFTFLPLIMIGNLSPWSKKIRYFCFHFLLFGFSLEFITENDGNAE